MTKSLKVYDLQALLGAEKEVSRKHSIMKQSLALMRFLQDNKLIRYDPFYSNGELKNDLVVWASDLSEEGRRFMDEEYPQWLAWVERGGNPEQMLMLTRRLTSLREKYGRP